MVGVVDVDVPVAWRMSLKHLRALFRELSLRLESRQVLSGDFENKTRSSIVIDVRRVMRPLTFFWKWRLAKLAAW